MNMNEIAAELEAEIFAEGRGLCTLALACEPVTVDDEVKSLMLDVGIGAGMAATLTVLKRRGLIGGVEVPHARL